MATFTRRRKTFDETTGLSTDTVTSISGSAIITTSGKSEGYVRLGLSPSAAPLILFTPDNYDLKAYTDEFVLPGDEIEILDLTWKARDVLPVSIDGFVILGKIIVERGG